MKKTNNKITINSEAPSYENIISYEEFSYHKSKNKQALSTRPLRILVADDSRTNQLQIAAILQKAGHAVTLVENGNHALDLLESDNFDLMILDSDMPTLNGLDTLKIHLTTNLGKPKTPVIILAADAMQHSVDSYLEAGADAYLTKPLDATKLINSIDRLTFLRSKCIANIIKFLAKT
jgi:CheY-like chemotaxis protein